jgi:hypothetical protein
MTKSFQVVLLTAVASGTLCAGAGTARATTYLQTDLVSDLSVLGAEVTDPNLKNSWGLSFQPGGPVWVSDQASQNAILYGVIGATVTKEALTVAIPPMGPVALRTSRQHQHVSVRGQRNRQIRALHLRQPERIDLRLERLCGNHGGHRNDRVGRNLDRARRISASITRHQTPQKSTPRVSTKPGQLKLIRIGLDETIREWRSDRLQPISTARHHTQSRCDQDNGCDDKGLFTARFSKRCQKARTRQDKSREPSVQDWYGRAARDQRTIQPRSQ